MLKFKEIYEIINYKLSINLAKNHIDTKVNLIQNINIVYAHYQNKKDIIYKFPKIQVFPLKMVIFVLKLSQPNFNQKRSWCDKAIGV